ncbi:mitochondrial translation factor Atp22p [Monosporozyma unispora]|nr:mitochondrial translation factor atp22 [Kazachstania unispora]
MRVWARVSGRIPRDRVVYNTVYRYRSLTRPISTTTTVPTIPSIDYNWIQFKTSLLSTINNNNNTITTSDKILQVYTLISTQHDFCQSNQNTRPISLPNAIHSWFIQNLTPEQWYDHINNMINWDINLSNSPYCQKMVVKLLQSTEFDIQLITLENYLITAKSQEQFINKFIKLYDWNTMILIVNNVVKRGNWKIIPYYLTALIEKLNQLQKNMSNVNDIKRQLSLQKSFIKFLIELLLILSSLNNWKLVIPIFKLIIESMNTLPPSTIQDNLSMLNKPILKIINLLRLNNQTDEIFQIISFLNNKNLLPNLLSSFQFQKRLLNEIVTCLRSFNDPKLTIQFLSATVKSPNIISILNELGMINLVFRNQIGVLSSHDLSEIIQTNSNQFISTNLKFKIDDMAPILNELYLVILKSNNEIMTPEENKLITLKLYNHYVTKLNKSIKQYYFWKNDTGVIIQFLKTIIYQLHDHSLAYEILLDFSNQKLMKKIRIVTSQSKILKNIDTTGQYKRVPVSYVNNNCPFTLLIQSSNKYLSMNQILKLLSIMQDKNIPLNFNICCSMILKLIHLKRIDDAKVWYDKIYYGQFDINHFILLYYVRKFNWPLPSNVNQESINEIDQLLGKGLSPIKSLLKEAKNEHFPDAETTDIDVHNGSEDDYLFMERQETDDSVFEEISNCLQRIKVI